MVFSRTTPRRPPVTASRSSVMFVAPMWAYTPTGSSVAVNPLTVTPADWLSSSPPAVSPFARMSSMRVSRSRIAARPNRPLPAVLTPVIGSFGVEVLRRMPSPALRSARIRRSTVPLSREVDRPWPSDSVTATSSMRTSCDPSSRSPMLLRVKVEPTTVPVLPALNWTAGRGLGPSSDVPRSVTVTSEASSRPPEVTTRNGRPGPAASGCPVAGSADVIVTPCSRIRPLPV